MLINFCSLFFRWWKDVGLGDRLSFARDRLIEYFFFATGIVFEPHLGYCREELTKAFALVAIIDDFYDIYGTPDELNLFTSAVQRLVGFFCLISGCI